MSEDATTRYVTEESENPERFRLFRLCDCPICEGKGKAPLVNTAGAQYVRCNNCRGEGRIRQEIATAATPEAVGVVIVTLAREGEFQDCPFGLLDQTPECERCQGGGVVMPDLDTCPDCKGTGIKPTGTWLIRPWLPSARNVSDAGRVLAKSKKKSDPQ